MKRGYKPKAKYKLFTAVWWNPIFWITISLFPICQGIKAFIDAWKELTDDIKDWDLS